MVVGHLDATPDESAGHEMFRDDFIWDDWSHCSKRASLGKRVIKFSPGKSQGTEKSEGDTDVN